MRDVWQLALRITVPAKLPRAMLILRKAYKRLIIMLICQILEKIIYLIDIELALENQVKRNFLPIGVMIVYYIIFL